MATVIKYNVSNNRVASKILKEIQPVSTLIPESRKSCRISYYDTFDWRLFEHGYYLMYKMRTLQLRQFKDEKIIAEAEYKADTQNPFWQNIPPGKLAKVLKRLITIRALIKLVEIQTASKYYRILNNDKKTIARLDSSVYKNIKDKTDIAHLFILDILRGYKNEARKVISIIEKQNVKPHNRHILIQVLDSIGKTPALYISKQSIILQPHLPATSAIGKILEQLFDIMAINCEGIIADIDTEFLHDFRVAIRRGRSIVGQMKNVLPPQITQKLKSDLTFFGKATNRLRDMDVYLLKKDQYFSRLPKDLWDGLLPFFDYVSCERQKEKKKIDKVLTDRETLDKITYWKKVFTHPVESNTRQAVNRPILAIAQKKILKKYNQVIQLGDQIDKQTPDTKLHNLRIVCKKLRYLLEFFQSLFPAQKINRFIKQVKFLQDNLGDFNDLHVQQLKLREYLDNISENHEQYIRISAAIGGLITHLHQEQLKARNNFGQTWRLFKKTDFRALFKK
ncbi:CHAD domain-containing protein [candidate division KSB1 bacterium]|nr:CHAD domain-containing protein [candidate division KSB1 bacterium]